MELAFHSQFMKANLKVKDGMFNIKAAVSPFHMYWRLGSIGFVKSETSCHGGLHGKKGGASVGMHCEV